MLSGRILLRSTRSIDSSKDLWGLINRWGAALTAQPCPWSPVAWDSPAPTVAIRDPVLSGGSLSEWVLAMATRAIGSRVSEVENSESLRHAEATAWRFTGWISRGTSTSRSNSRCCALPPFRSFPRCSIELPRSSAAALRKRRRMSCCLISRAAFSAAARLQNCDGAFREHLTLSTRLAFRLRRGRCASLSAPR